MKELRSHAKIYAKGREFSMQSHKVRVNTRHIWRIYARSRRTAVPSFRSGVFTPEIWRIYARRRAQDFQDTDLAYLRQKPGVFTPGTAASDFDRFMHSLDGGLDIFKAYNLGTCVWTLRKVEGDKKQPKATIN